MVSKVKLLTGWLDVMELKCTLPSGVAAENA